MVFTLARAAKSLRIGPKLKGVAQILAWGLRPEALRKTSKLIKKQTSLICETLAAAKELAHFVETSPWEKKQRPALRKLQEAASKIFFHPGEPTFGLQNLLSALSSSDASELLDALDAQLKGRLDRFTMRGCVENCRQVLHLGCTLIHELQANDLSLYALTFPTRNAECRAWLKAIQQFKEDDLRRSLLSFMEEFAQPLMHDQRESLQKALTALNERFEALRDRLLPETLDCMELEALLAEGPSELADEDERDELCTLFSIALPQMNSVDLKQLCESAPKDATKKSAKLTKTAQADLVQRNLNHCCERACLWAQIARLDANATRRELAHLAETQYRRAIYTLRHAKDVP